MKHVWRIFRAPKNLRYEVWNLSLPMPTLIKSNTVSLQNVLWKIVQLSNHWNKNVFWGLQVEINWGQILLFTPQQKESQLLHLSLLQYQQWCLFKKQTHLPTELLFTDGFQHLQIQVIPRLKKVGCGSGCGLDAWEFYYPFDEHVTCISICRFTLYLKLT